MATVQDTYFFAEVIVAFYRNVAFLILFKCFHSLPLLKQQALRNISDKVLRANVFYRVEMIFKVNFNSLFVLYLNHMQRNMKSDS